MKYKYGIVFLVYFVFCAADWLFANIPIINALSTGYFTEYDIFMNLHTSLNGYSGLQEIMVVYTIPVLIGIWCLSIQERPYILLRFRNRTVYMQTEMRKAAITSVGFSLIHEIVDYALVSRYLDRDMLKENDFLKYCIFMTLLLGIFYMETGCVYYIISDLAKNRLSALLGAFLINFVQFTVLKYMNGIWLPGADTIAPFDYLDGVLGVGGVLLIALRGEMVTAVLYILCQIVFEKRDILKNEEK